MPVTVQASNQSTLQFSNPGNALVTTSYVTSSSLTDTHLLSPQQPALQRNTVSPGLPQRPASAGEDNGKPEVGWRWINTDYKTVTHRHVSKASAGTFAALYSHCYTVTFVCKDVLYQTHVKHWCAGVITFLVEAQEYKTFGAFHIL